MICVSLGNISFEKLQEALLHHNFFELRLDLLDISTSQFTSLIKQKKKWLITFRTTPTKKKLSPSESDFLKIALNEKVAFIDIDYLLDDKENILNQIKEHKSTKIIFSYHHIGTFPGLSFLQEKLSAIKKFNPNIIKLVCETQNASDRIALNSLYENSTTPLIAFDMGVDGKLSRLHCLQLGAPFTYAYWQVQTAPNQFSLDEMLFLLKKFGIKNEKY